MEDFKMPWILEHAPAKQYLCDLPCRSIPQTEMALSFSVPQEYDLSY